MKMFSGIKFKLITVFILAAVLIVTTFLPVGLTITSGGMLSFRIHTVFANPDPAYTEDMDSWDSDTYASDGAWTNYNLTSNKGVPMGAVAEIIMANYDFNEEEYMGVRTDGSSLERKVELHESEGGGYTTCRMFVLCHATTGIIETYHEDVSDAHLFYLVGYWEDVGFTERWDDETPSESGAWDEEALVDSGAANRVCHIILRNGAQDKANTMGVRDTSSALERKILVHEPEGGGESILDMLVKADASYSLDFYATSDTGAKGGGVTFITNAGYFGSDMDFVEKWEDIYPSGGSESNWRTIDISALLDQDGRMVDIACRHKGESSESYLGVRDGDDTSTERKIPEHEAESAGAGDEYTGFCMSAQSNTSGVIYIYYKMPDLYWIAGYFKPVAAGEADISNVPSSKAFGVVNDSTTYWSNGSEPSWPLVDGDAFFTVTNNGDTCSITIEATNFTGGVGWTLGTPGENVVRLTGFKEGDGSGDGVTLTTSPQSFITGLSTNIDWELKMETPTSYTDGEEKTTTLTLTGTLD